MRLEVFVNERRDSWYRLQELVRRYQSKAGLPDHELSEMVRLYRSACADYAYVQSAYPYERVITELNQLIGQAHTAVYGTRRIDRTGVFRLLFHEAPHLFRKHIRFFSIAFALFVGGLFLSFFGSFLNPELPRYFLGDHYVDFTRSQIDTNDPFAIYKQEDSPVMSSFIMTNNIKVTFITFAMGIFAGLGTVYILFSNGMMLGAFLYLFFEKGLLTDAFLTIMMHGTLELTSIFIAGMGGLLIGKGLLWPGNYTRSESLRYYGNIAVKLIIACIPLLILAGIIEGFVTRLAVQPELKILFIACNLTFLFWYLGVSGRKPDSSQ